MSFRFPFSSAAMTAALLVASTHAAPAVFVNQVAYDSRGPKPALFQTDARLTGAATASLIDDATSAEQATAPLGDALQNAEWAAGKFFYRADFTAFTKPGTYRVRATLGGVQVTSEPFKIGENALATQTLPSIVQYYFKQRATSSQEWAADEAVLVNDGSKRVNMRGGWCDASGDVSKYFSHLAYSNFVNPQQTPMVTWELTDAYERIGELVASLGQKDALQAEALWGADYLVRAMAPEGYFHMVVFSFFNPNASARRIVGLLADSKTNNRWQASFRHGGGMAIAALARISAWKKDGTAFTSQNYLDGAEKAYAHLLLKNKDYNDDGKDNVIDDMCALMAATELWKVTGKTQYRDDARKRMENLAGRVTTAGYFRANDANRPFWHAADAGLPVVSLVRYLDVETDPAQRTTALTAIRKNLDYQVAVTANVENPFGYARQTFLYNGAVKDGYFIPQTNETNWWWQGENARLGSLAAAAILGGRLVYPAANGWGVREDLAAYAQRQISWILGLNPFSVTFMHGFGKNNPPLISALFGHGTQKGGIANGVTGRKGAGDGSGIDYKTTDGGNEWRWIEQWIPHSGWFLTATAAMVQQPIPVRALPHQAAARTPGAEARLADGLLTLRLASPASDDIKLDLFGADGRTAGSWILPKGQASLTVDAPSVTPGLHFLKAGTGAASAIILQ